MANDDYMTWFAAHLLYGAYQAGVALQQSRCAHCDVPLDGVTKHGEGCLYPKILADQMRNYEGGLQGNLLQNAFATRETAEQSCHPDEDPPCTCTRVDVDRDDARGCELHDERSEYNREARRREAEKHPATRPVESESGDCPF